MKMKKKDKRRVPPTEESPIEEPSENDVDHEEEHSKIDDDGMKLQNVVSVEKRPKVTPLVKKKKNKAGIIYISSIPKHMNVTLMRGLLEPYGEVGRIYLEPERKGLIYVRAVESKGRKLRQKTASGKSAMIKYTEGWVEFTDKRVAKAIVPALNTKPISTNKKSTFCDILWTMKYLPRFKWVNLSERLAYERVVAREKMRAEIQQTRAEAAVFEAAMSSSAAIKAKKRTKTNTRKLETE